MRIVKVLASIILLAVAGCTSGGGLVGPTYTREGSITVPAVRVPDVIFVPVREQESQVVQRTVVYNLSLATDDERRGRGRNHETEGERIDRLKREEKRAIRQAELAEERLLLAKKERCLDEADNKEEKKECKKRF